MQQITISSEHGFDSKKYRQVKHKSLTFEVISVVQEIQCFELDGITYRGSEDFYETPDREWYETTLEVLPLSAEEVAKRIKVEKELAVTKENARQEELEGYKIEWGKKSTSFQAFLSGDLIGFVWSGHDLPKEVYDSESPLKLSPHLYQKMDAGNSLGYWCHPQNLENLFEFVRSHKSIDQEQVHQFTTIYKNCAGAEYYRWLVARQYAEIRHPSPLELRFKIGDAFYTGSKDFCTGYYVDQDSDRVPVSWDKVNKRWETNGQPVDAGAVIRPAFETGRLTISV